MKRALAIFLVFIGIISSCNSHINSIVHLGQKCSDESSCLEFHLQNPAFLGLISNRCNIDRKVRKHGPKVTFTHLPKAGGSSIRTVLNSFIRTRHRRPRHEHEHFVLSAVAEPRNLFAVVLREPVARAISFFTYVGERVDMNEDQLNNRLWALTWAMKSDPLGWASNPFIQRTLKQDPLGFFLRNVTNITDSITRFNYTAIQRMPRVQLRAFVENTTSLEDMLDQTKLIPTEYQCREHLEVAFILLKHYEVVGVLENLTEFYTILSHRAMINSSIIDVGINTRENKSGGKLVTAEDIEQMRNLLQPVLFCSSVLWTMAGRISKADAACVPPPVRYPYIPLHRQQQRSSVSVPPVNSSSVLKFSFADRNERKSKEQDSKHGKFTFNDKKSANKFGDSKSFAVQAVQESSDHTQIGGGSTKKVKQKAKLSARMKEAFRKALTSFEQKDVESDIIE